ncbi:MAG: orotidine 5'-phosphate decarboxylase [Deltaproteobacteria bacterium RBG_13_52_11]|nr:MAG: orotidine 5'-phosphate decarboxylase [Deltaproteobacteria bacterium RBG_13_52_11]
MRAANPIIFALDVGSWAEAQRFVEELREWVWGFKIGKELFTWMGPKVVEMVQERGGKVFLDLKYHDIPATVAKASAMATRLRVSMFNLHALGGMEMMRAAVEASHEAAQKAGLPPPLILGVTVLTSLRAGDLQEVGITLPVEEEVVHLAALAQQAGLDGVVASPLEIKRLRETCGEDMVIVTPGVRPYKGLRHDQARVMTPHEAVEAGADFLVIGRPIRDAVDPLRATQEILQEIRSAT